YYTTNLRYDQDTNDTAVALPDLECRSAAQTGPFYTYQFAPNQPAQATFILQAVPQGSQATGDAQCGTLTLDQTGKRDITGDGPVSDCWR
ncbi:MAG TPA: type IV pilin protein, partial [Dyella sp.]|nr:type IV pilin protein [Dyella sp.]